MNNAKRFLRGGSVSNALKIEEDSLQEHTHYHTLTDDGHTHAYTDQIDGDGRISQKQYPGRRDRDKITSSANQTGKYECCIHHESLLNGKSKQCFTISPPQKCFNFHTLLCPGIN